MSEAGTALETIFKGWEEYQGHILKALAPLSAEQLALRAGPNLRSIGDIATHMIGARARWLTRTTDADGGDSAPLAQLRSADRSALTADELVAGLETTWGILRSSLDRWTDEELARPFTARWGDEEVTFTRQWIVWHLIEHDLHHGGELSYSLGMHGLAAPDL